MRTLKSFICACISLYIDIYIYIYRPLGIRNNKEVDFAFLRLIKIFYDLFSKTFSMFYREKNSIYILVIIIYSVSYCQF